MVWLSCVVCLPPLPSSKKPLIIYSNHQRSDLKKTYLRAIRSAKTSIHLQIYGLTDPDLIALLTKKKAQGVDVQIFYDKKGSSKLPSFACPVQTSGLMHRKILIVDREKLWIGTANATPQSLKMHDNLVLGLCHAPLADFLRKSIEDEAFYLLEDRALSTYLLPDFHGNALIALLKNIEQATDSIQIAMFTLTHPAILAKLKEACQRKVAVSIAIDRYTGQGASKQAIDQLREAGATIRTSQGSQLLHHKWALFDQSTLVLGSANWTRAAFEKNQDILLMIEGLTPKEQKTFQKIWKAVAKATKKG